MDRVQWMKQYMNEHGATLLQANAAWKEEFPKEAWKRWGLKRRVIEKRAAAVKECERCGRQYGQAVHLRCNSCDTCPLAALIRELAHLLEGL